MTSESVSVILAELKAANRAANVPSISESTADLLADLVHEHGTRSLLELGTAHGYSTIRLAYEIRANLSETVQPSVSESSPSRLPIESDPFAANSSDKPIFPSVKALKPVLTIDFSKPSFEAAIANVARAGLSDCVEHVFGDALAILPALGERCFDAVFLDAEKRSTARLFELAWPLVNPGGWMVVDDVVKFRSKMTDFYELVERLRLPHEIVMTDPDDGVMVFRKR